ncbi:MAG: ABC transporter ATP-binding protein [Magnetococcales bacterium]|nr:ABC transporter ATP-binding protein [Magnetococcales bacterium]
MSGAPLLEVENLTIEIEGRTLVKSLNLTLSTGQSWAVLGRNGVGKSRLIHTLAGLQKPATGTIRLAGHLIEKLSRRQIAQQLGILFQQEANAFPATVLETAMSGRFPHMTEWQREKEDDYKRVADALNMVNLQGVEQRRGDTLSGGERRRLDLGVLLVQDPDLFLLDEPTNHLDLHYQIHLLEQMLQLTKKQNKVLFMVLHDINLASRFCDHLLLLHDSGNYESGKLEVIMDEVKLSKVYGHPIKRIQSNNRDYWFPA